MQDKSTGITVSVVSHRHGEMVVNLLERLTTCPLVNEVVLTLNVPEPKLVELREKKWPFHLAIRINTVPQSFARNHNQAFLSSRNSFYAVLNPDVSWEDDPFPGLLRSLNLSERIGASYPLQSDTSEMIALDKGRAMPTPWSLFRRHIFKTSSNNDRTEEKVWVNASFLLFQRQAFLSVGGFDEGYRMYCEDVDVGLKMLSLGYSLRCAQDVNVVHPGGYASRKDWQHFYWHTVSLFKLWARWLGRDPIK